MRGDAIVLIVESSPQYGAFLHITLRETGYGGSNILRVSFGELRARLSGNYSEMGLLVIDMTEIGIPGILLLNTATNTTLFKPFSFTREDLKNAISSFIVEQESVPR